MPERDLSVLDGSTFVVGDRLGDVRADEGREHGFFAADTRFVSHWVLRVGETPLELLSLDQDRHFDAQFVLTPVVGPEDQAACSIVRRRLIDRVWIEDITVINHLHRTAEISVALDIGADFADLFEVKEDKVAERQVDFADRAGKLVLSYSRDDFHRSLTVASTEPGAVTPSGFLFALTLGPAEQWSTTFTITPGGPSDEVAADGIQSQADMRRRSTAKSSELDGWLGDAPVLESDDPDLIRTYRAGISDLGALRMHPDEGLAATLPAAGLPWFMALFGRDSLITSLQALPYEPGLAATTLRALAVLQAHGARRLPRTWSPARSSTSCGSARLTVRGERPHSPYFGIGRRNAPVPRPARRIPPMDRRGEDLTREFEPYTCAALDWIAESGDRDGDGYLEYDRAKSEASGLVNQCWKDSWNAIQFADGILGRGSIATAEIQGYV